MHRHINSSHRRFTWCAANEPKMHHQVSEIFIDSTFHVMRILQDEIASPPPAAAWMTFEWKVRIFLEIYERK